MFLRFPRHLLLAFLALLPLLGVHSPARAGDRVIIREFHNRAYHTKGLLKRTVLQDAAGRLYTETQQEYTLATVDVEGADSGDDRGASRFPQLTRTEQLWYEGQGSAGKRTFTTHRYDEYGNVIEFFDAGDVGALDDVHATIAYSRDTAAHIVGKPTQITVQGGGRLMRRREATYAPGTGNLLQVREYLENGQAAVTAGRVRSGNPTFVNYFARRQSWPILDHARTRKFKNVRLPDLTLRPTNGNLAMSTDFKGVKTTYTYDLARNLELTATEAAGTSEARTTTTQWHATLRLPVRVAEPKRVTSYTYDSKGNMLSKTVQATTDANGSQAFTASVTGTARTWTYTYNQLGQMLTEKGPRADVNDTTSYAYSETTGNLVSKTDALGHVTSYDNYDANGRVGRITEPNGRVTEFTYTPRGWMSSMAVSAGGVTETTSYEYDGVGQLTRTVAPDGSTVMFTYDDAHRLVEVADGQGNRISYTLDAAGNRISEQVSDPSGTVARQVQRVFDTLGRVQQQTGVSL